MTPQGQAQARYEAKVREIAQEMMDNSQMPFPKNKMNLEIIFIPAARIAIRYMTDEISEAMKDDYSAYQIQIYLQERDLVPVNVEP